MVPESKLIAAVGKLEPWRGVELGHTSVIDVNWRQGFQISIVWNQNPALRCFLDFRKNADARDKVLRLAKERYGPVDISNVRRPSIRHLYDEERLSFSTPAFISVNQIVAIAEREAFKHSVLYVAELASGRELFDDLGIPLKRGENGREWKNGRFVRYVTPSGMNM